MSARPAMRTLLAIIFAASAMSYRMPESSPVASGNWRSCSMMNRSIVTTEVAVCLTTLRALGWCGDRFGEGGLRRRWPFGEHAASEGVRLCLESVVAVSPAQRLQAVAERERAVLTKLTNMTELVQE